MNAGRTNIEGTFAGHTAALTFGGDNAPLQLLQIMNLIMELLD